VRNIRSQIWQLGRRSIVELCAGVFASPTGKTFTNLSPIVDDRNALSESTACNAWIASDLVSGVSVFKTIEAAGRPARSKVRPTSFA